MNDKKTITLNPKRIKIYIPITVLLYLLLAVCLITYKGEERANLLYCALFPIIICIVGAADFNISSRIKNIAAVFLFLFTPDFIISKILNNGDIIYLQSKLLNVALIMIAMLVLFILFGSTKIAEIVPAAFCFLLFAANELVTAFRGSPVTPVDLWAAKTAMTVSVNYSFFISPDMLSSLVFLILLIALSRIFAIKAKKHPILLRLPAAALIAALCIFINVIISITDGNAMPYDGFAISASNKNFGTVATLYTGVKDMFVSKPEGYSDQGAEQLLEKYTPSEENNKGVRPNLVVIMNESFCDFANIADYSPSSDPLEYWHTLTENTKSGDLLVPVQGGGTSYTEYEFLSGIGGGIFKGGYNFFLRGVHDNTYSIAWDLKKLGYKNIAIHPFWASCWNRETVYPRLGFDDFISGEDFDNTKVYANNSGYLIDSTDLGDIDYVRDYASDKESYAKVIEQFENKAEDERLFVFNVTMQNHGGYYYEGDNFEYKVLDSKLGIGEDSQYLSLLKYSDEAYRELIDYFKAYPQPTVVLMFGDHQPAVSGYEPSEAYGEKYGERAKYVTNYKIWANYPLPDDIGGCTEDIGTGFLSVSLKEAAGLPLNQWDMFRKELNAHFKGVSLYGTAKEKDGKIEYDSELSDAEQKLIDNYEILEYYIFFRGGLLE